MEQECIQFSIIIPTYNRLQNLKDCLQSLTRMNYPRKKFEVVVVDDGSSISLKPVFDLFREQLNLVIIRQDNSGPAKARNTGASLARGEFLLFTDDDCAPDPAWINVFSDYFQENPDHLLGGKTINALSKNLYSAASQILIDYLYQYYNSKGLQGSFFASNNLALSNKNFQAVGGFDTIFPLAAGEDRDFSDRWLFYGKKMVYLPEAKVYHSHYLTFYKFIRQHFNYGRGAFYFRKVRSSRNSRPIKVEPLKFYLDLLYFPFLVRTEFPSLLLCGLLFISQVANLIGFFWEVFYQTTRNLLKCRTYGKSVSH